MSQIKDAARFRQTDERYSSMLDELKHDSFGYFINEYNSDTGLVADKTRLDWPASIAATGLALAAYLVGVARGLSFYGI